MRDVCRPSSAFIRIGYSPDDNRFDLRQFVYNVRWPRQFGVIDKLVEKADEAADKVIPKK